MKNPVTLAEAKESYEELKKMVWQLEHCPLKGCSKCEETAEGLRALLLLFVGFVPTPGVVDLSKAFMKIAADAIDSASKREAAPNN